MRLCRLLFFTALLILLQGLFSCGVLNFRELGYEVFLENEDGVFDEEYIRIDFSCFPDKKCFEDLARLRLDDRSVETDFHWDNSSCLVCPRLGWCYGGFYSFGFEGLVKTEGDGSFYTFYKKYFYYGRASERIRLCSVSLDGETEVLAREALVLEFSKELSQKSFLENFSILPYTEYSVEFDKSKAVVVPVEDWRKNTIFRWRLPALEAKDGYCLDKAYDGTFSSAFVYELPYVRGIHRVLVENEEFVWLDRASFAGDSFLRIKNGEALGIEFSVPMDTESVESAISFYPSLSGGVKADMKKSDGMHFVFILEDKLEPMSEYRLEISPVAKSRNGLSVFSDFREFFVSGSSYLEVTQIRQEHFFQGDEDSVLFETGTDAPAAEYRMLFGETEDGSASFIISFSTAIPVELRQLCEENISFEPVFPSFAEYPAVTSIKWNEAGTEVCFCVEGFSIGSEKEPVYYRLKINGGKKSIVNTSGEYLKEDVCVILKALG